MADLASTKIYGTLEVADIINSTGAITAPNLTLTQTTGTAPMTITSTTLVPNLNADLLDGQQGTYYLTASNLTGTLSADRIASASLALSKIANISADTFLGRNTTGSGVIEELSLSTVKTKLSLTGTNSGDQNIFSTIAVSGQSSVIADTTSDTLTLIAGSNVSITTDATNDTITINSSYTNTASASDGILEGSNSGTEVSYAPYSTQQNILSFDTSASTPTLTNRLNVNGYLYATQLYEGATRVLTRKTSDTTVTTQKFAMFDVSSGDIIRSPLTFNDSGTTTTEFISASQVNTRIDNAVTGIGARILAPVADLTAFKAVDTTNLVDKTMINCETLGLYRLDLQSSDTADDNRIIAPTTGSGRWIKMSSSINDHNNLTNIQGGATGDYQHLTTTQLGYIHQSGSDNQNLFSHIHALNSSGVDVTNSPYTASSTTDNIQLKAGTNVTLSMDSSGIVTITSTDTNTNYYPTTFAWSNGTTAGPTGSLTGSGMSAVSFGAIPSASGTVSGIITTGTQTIAGAKTFNDTIVGSITGNAGTATKLATARTINGVSFDGVENITINAVDSTARIATSLMGVANGVATLDSSGLIPTSQLPSYVDDALEYTNLASFPTTGETGKIYVALDTNKIYRWSGSTYIEVSANASTADAATKLATARNIGLTGDASGSGSFDGTTDLSITVTVADDSHNHIISNVDGLQTALDAKANLSAPTFTGTVTGTFSGALTGNVTGNVSGSSGSCTGNSATATKLANARTLSLTGDVTGSGSFDGTGDLSITATVADDSHKHTELVPFVSGTQTSATNVFTGNASTISALYDGLSIRYWLPYAGTSTTATLNLTLSDSSTTGAKTVYFRGTSGLTTHYAAGSVISLTYRENVSISGSGSYTGWWCDADYYNSDTYDRTYWANTITAGAAIYSYKLLMQGNDGKFYPLTLETGTGTTKTVSTQEFTINTPILYYATSTTVSANGTLSNVYSEIPIGLNYTANQASWTSQLPIYLKGTVLSNGNFKLDNTSYTSFMTQTLPTSEDGFVYILLGYMYSTTAMRLMQYHPIYEYKDGCLREYIPAHKHGNITNAGAIGSTAGLMIKTGADGVLETLTTGTSGQYLQYDGTWSTPPDTDTDTNYYPTTFTWTDGTTSGPTGSLTGSGMSAVSFGAIPTASGTVSGIITTGSQTITGAKTFSSNIIANVTGNVSGSSGSCTGNAGTATKLATARNIGLSGITATSQSFTGESDITIPVTAIPASLLTGTIDIARLPVGALERMVIVADETARFALTTTDVQIGDVVKQTDTGLVYYVKDIANLSNTNGYESFTTGTATSVPWSGITSKPTTISGYGITDIYSFKSISDGTNIAVADSSADTLNITGSGSTTVTCNATTDTITINSTDTNYYPTTFSWTNGTSSGPTGSLTGSGMSAVSFGAIPSASATTSGIITTGAQTFSGAKTFDAIYVGTALYPKVNNEVSLGTYSTKWYDVYATYYYADNVFTPNILGNSTLTLNSSTTYALTIDSTTTGPINIGTNANAKTITIGNTIGTTSLVLKAGTGNIITTGKIVPNVDLTDDLGTSTKKYNNVYAGTFHGSFDGTATNATNAGTAAVCSGNSATATKASCDENGNIITSYYSPITHIHGNLTSAGAIGSTSGLLVKTGASGVLTTLSAGTSGQFLQYDGTWATPPGGTDTNYYPTTFTWSNGTTSGPTGSLTGSGMSAVSFGAIPSASDTVSGIINTTMQTIAGYKTFSTGIAVNGTLTTGNDILPDDNGNQSLGNSSYKWYKVTSSNFEGNNLTSTGALTLNSTTTNALTIDSTTTGAINIGTNANAKTITIGNSTGATGLVLNTGSGNITVGGSIISDTDNTDNLGSATKKFANVYATTFTGSLSGNASTATKATQDGSGNTITSYYSPITHTHGNITSTGAIGSTSGLIVKTTTSGVLTTLAAGSAGQYLQYDGTWSTPNTVTTPLTKTVTATASQTEFTYTADDGWTADLLGMLIFRSGVYMTPSTDYTIDNVNKKITFTVACEVGEIVTAIFNNNGAINVTYTPPDATTSVKGVVELADSTETATGTSTTLAVTPAGLKTVTDTMETTIANDYTSYVQDLSYPYVTCDTASATAAKTASLTDFALYTGARISIKFTNANTATSPTLNINSTGAKSIYINGAVATTFDAKIYDLIYDGTNWVVLNSNIFLKDTYISGSSWYRIYSDGWIEQGGIVDSNTQLETVTFLKAFSNTNYTLLTSIEATSSYVYTANIYAKTTTTAQIKKYFSTSSAAIVEPVDWIAKGF